MKSFLPRFFPCAIALAFASSLLAQAPVAQPSPSPSPARVRVSRPDGGWKIEIEHNATVAEFTAAMQTAFPHISLLVEPDVRSYPLTRMEGRLTQPLTAPKVNAIIQLASERRLLATRVEDDTFILEKGEKDARWDQDVAAFYLLDFLPMEEEARERKLAELRVAITEAANDLAKQANRPTSDLGFALHRGVNLLIVTGRKDDVQVARKVFEALEAKSQATPAP